MENRNILIAGAVLLLIIVGMFVVAYMERAEIRDQDTSPTVSPDEEPASPYAGIDRIDATHFFIDGTHTITGEIPLPTPCDLLEWDARVMESQPEQVVIDFTVVNESDVCAQVVTPQRFKVSFDASEEADIRATLQGENITLNLIPAAEGESPDDFELFIKG